MNKDLLLDAIGMVDEKTLHEAADIKRTKRVTGCVTVLVVLLVLITPLVAVFAAISAMREDIKEYTLTQLEYDINHDNILVFYNESDPLHPQTIDMPSDFTETLRLSEWRSVSQKEAQKQLKDAQPYLRLHIYGTTLILYDRYATAEKYDWNSFEGAFSLPEGLWQEVLQVLSP